ncbi:MAG TPA: hypothetical protein VF899_12980 [Pyrinomonadaceae bacterium]
MKHHERNASGVSSRIANAFQRFFAETPAHHLAQMKHDMQEKPKRFGAAGEVVTNERPWH